MFVCGRLPFQSQVIQLGVNFPRQQAGFSILSWKSLEPYVLAVGTEKRSWTPGFGLLAQYLDYVLIHTQAGDLGVRFQEIVQRQAIQKSVVFLCMFQIPTEQRTFSNDR